MGKLRGKIAIVTASSCGYVFILAMIFIDYYICIFICLCVFFRQTERQTGNVNRFSL